MASSSLYKNNDPSPAAGLLQILPPQMAMATKKIGDQDPIDLCSVTPILM